MWGGTSVRYTLSAVVPSGISPEHRCCSAPGRRHCPYYEVIEDKLTSKHHVILGVCDRDSNQIASASFGGTWRAP